MRFGAFVTIENLKTRQPYSLDETLDTGHWILMFFFMAFDIITTIITITITQVVMLTEGAKPGTPHITPRKIYPDGIDLFIEVESSLIRDHICH